MKRAVVMLAWLALAGLVTGCDALRPDRDQALARAEQALAAGDTAGAQAILRRVLAYDPRDTEARLALAETLTRRGDDRQVLRLISELPADTSLSPELLHARARALLAIGDQRRALPDLIELERLGLTKPSEISALVDQLLLRDIRPRLLDRLPTAWMRPLAEALVDHQRYGEAVDALRRLPTEDRGRQRIAERLMEIALAGSQAALTALEPLLDGVDGDAASLLRYRQHLRQGRRVAARAEEERFLSLFPDSPLRVEIVLKRARQALWRGDLEAALDLADEATALTEEPGDAVVLKGLALRGLGRTDESNRLFSLVLAFDPTHRIAREALESERSLPELLRLEVEMK